MTRLLFVHAHPDDETLWNGVTIAHHALAGDDVHVATCTLGEEGEVIPPELEHLEGSEDLADVRRAELSGALQVLGATGHLLGFRDSGMVGSPAAADPRALVNNLAAATAALRELIDELQPDVLVTYEQYGGYGHPDHIATHRATVAAAGQLPVWQTVVPKSWAQQDREWVANHPLEPGLSPVPVDAPWDPSVVPDDTVTHRVVDEAAGGVRAKALTHHRTQVVVHDGYFALSNNVAKRLGDREAFVS
ncbi:PIG-L family deacetylase [Branchiibius sp. NY16-3462-2]|uniref:PIG-L family deacetylase n=1 Tax=Branchiibius sp. NY16-3462-2 TaxID=1807500 RepID=UPI000792FE8E|nr:PIG-L family deacetylase [Branchiibius sp. NY16-3462-2]KYH45989.1 hypothetical protein AZH51_10040 [Branchiibius sp. NY16-3462-2]